MLTGLAWQGLDDLRNGVIRTPLSPKETFNDDPLRVIRCVRFSSRFGFDMVPELKEAAMHPDIQVSIFTPVSGVRLKHWRSFRRPCPLKSAENELVKNWIR